MLEIKSIEKGWGQDSIYYSTSVYPEAKRVDEIREEKKFVGDGQYCDLTLLVYRGYKAGELVF